MFVSFIFQIFYNTNSLNNTNMINNQKWIVYYKYLTSYIPIININIRFIINKLLFLLYI